MKSRKGEGDGRESHQNDPVDVTEGKDWVQLFPALLQGKVDPELTAIVEDSKGLDMDLTSSQEKLVQRYFNSLIQIKSVGIVRRGERNKRGGNDRGEPFVFPSKQTGG